MSTSWFTIADGAGSLGSPGIYQWLLDGLPIYTGRALNPRTRLAQYDRNVRRLREKAPYRRGNPDGFRDIHRRLFVAAAAGADIKFRVVENCDSAALNERERHHQHQMRLTSPPAVALDQLMAEVGKFVFCWSACEQGLAGAIQDARRCLSHEPARVTGSFADRLDVWRTLCSTCRKTATGKIW